LSDCEIDGGEVDKAIQYSEIWALAEVSQVHKEKEGSKPGKHPNAILEGYTLHLLKILQR